MATTARRWTVEEVEALPEEHPGDRHELIDGELVVTPSPIPVHQIISKNLTFQLERHTVIRNLGTLIAAPIDVRFTADNVLIPDLVYLAPEHLDAIGDKAIVAAPDLVIEILSPGTRRRDLTVKREIYARFRVREYWIVDPNARSVRVLAPTGDRYVEIPVGADGTIRSVVLPGLELALEAVFRGV